MHPDSNARIDGMHYPRKAASTPRRYIGGEDGNSSYGDVDGFIRHVGDVPQPLHLRDLSRMIRGGDPSLLESARVYDSGLLPRPPAFSFRQRHVRIDWRAICAADPDEVVSVSKATEVNRARILVNIITVTLL